MFHVYTFVARFFAIVEFDFEDLFHFFNSKSQTYTFSNLFQDSRIIFIDLSFKNSAYPCNDTIACYWCKLGAGMCKNIFNIYTHFYKLVVNIVRLSKILSKNKYQLRIIFFTANKIIMQICFVKAMSWQIFICHLNLVIYHASNVNIKITNKLIVSD